MSGNLQVSLGYDHSYLVIFTFDLYMCAPQSFDRTTQLFPAVTITGKSFGEFSRGHLITFIN